VNVGNHGSDVSSTVRALSTSRVLDGFDYKAIEICRPVSHIPTSSAAESDPLTVLQSRLVEVLGVSLVERIDLASLGDGDLGVSEDELSEGFVEGETVDSLTGGQNQLQR